MEASLVCTSDSQTLTYKQSQLQFSCAERIKKRLDNIAAPPSSIIILPPSSHLEPPVTDPSDLPVSTNTESTGGRDTAATSVLSLPKIFSAQKFYVSPSTPMDEGLQSVWRHQIFDRLNQTLKIAVPTGLCLQEFLHMGRRSNALRPTLVINCGDARIKRQVEKAFKNQTWLQELLKSKGITFIALVVNISLSSSHESIHQQPVDQMEAHPVQGYPSDPSTSCGLNLLFKDGNTGLGQRCTLGGLIAVDGAIVGLTAGHLIQDFENHAPSVPVESAEDPDEDQRSEVSSEPFVFNGDDDDATGASRTSSDSSHPQVEEPSPCINEPISVHDRSPATSPPTLDLEPPISVLCPLPPTELTSFGDKRRDYSDWALFQDLPPPVKSRPNMSRSIDSHVDTPIDGIVSGRTFGPVTICILGLVPRLAYLHSSPAAMKIGLSIFNVQLMTMDKILPLGSSGAWVVSGNKLCGHIIAIREDVPWAYMMAIEPIFDNIRLELGVDDVRLPTIAEINSAASLHGHALRSLRRYESGRLSLPLHSSAPAMQTKGPDRTSQDSHMYYDPPPETRQVHLSAELPGSFAFPELPNSTASDQESLSLLDMHSDSVEPHKFDIVTETSTLQNEMPTTSKRQETPPPEHMTHPPTKKAITWQSLDPDPNAPDSIAPERSGRSNPYRQKIEMRQKITTPPLTWAGGTSTPNPYVPLLPGWQRSSPYREEVEQGQQTGTPAFLGTERVTAFNSCNQDPLQMERVDPYRIELAHNVTDSPLPTSVSRTSGLEHLEDGHTESSQEPGQNFAVAGEVMAWCRDVHSTN
ncbi:MAG: hypothetical protein Q9180_004898 [Flavoplaca navasiana]